MAPKLDRRRFLIATGVAGTVPAIVPRALAGSRRLVLYDLQVDSLCRPLGLENPRPCFSWKLESTERNVKQIAYQILVASSELALRQRRADLWDSGRIASDRSLGIEYAGPPLVSRQRCHWRVKVWSTSQASPVISDISGWEMGLLSVEDWQADWVAVEDAAARGDREAGLRWIWGNRSEGDETRRFRASIHLEHRATRARLVVGGRDEVTGLWLDGAPLPTELIPKPSVTAQPLSTHQIGPLASGLHVLCVEVKKGGVFPFPKPDYGMAALLRVETENTEIVRITSGAQWRTSLTRDSMWYQPDYDDSRWEFARTVPLPVQPWPATPAMHLRKQFAVDKPVARARLYATALGSYESRLNGQRVGDALLTPECTQFSQKVLYRCYDVTALVRLGYNVLGLTVGDGWYASTLFPAGRYEWGAPPRRALAQLELFFVDGSQQLVATGPDWRIAQSAIQCSEIYDGERYDARLEQQGWDTSDFDDSHWENAGLAERPSGRLVAQTSPSIRATQILSPRSIDRPAEGVYVFDFGQNFAGWCRLHVSGAAGTRIDMKFAETLLPSGEVDRSSLRRAAQMDVFILAGRGMEVFEPRFTYHGFRYVQISGLPTPPTLKSLEGIVLHSDLDMTGEMRVDNPLLEQIWRCTVWAQRSNFMGLPTDCPQRDERLAYLGDAGIFWDAACFNMDVRSFTARYIEDILDHQSTEGVYPEVAPSPRAPSVPTPGWSDAGIILPWVMWRRYNDLALVRRCWESMNRYVNFILKRNPDYIWRNSRVDIGDWLGVDDKYMLEPTTPNELIATAYWAHDLAMLVEMGEAIGQAEDSTALRVSHECVRSAFARAFVQEDGQVGNGSQTSYVLALKFGLVPDRVKPQVVERFVANIRARGNALSTGFLGTQYILDVLADVGHSELAYDLLLRTAYPSWGYMIANGATTIWESWNGRVWSGPKGASMPNSYNHFALGSVCGFLFRRLVGIADAAPGFKHILIRPLVNRRLKRCGGHYDSVLGRISAHWEYLGNDELSLKVVVPTNSQARIHVPARSDQNVVEGRRSIMPRSDIRVLGRFEEEIVIEVGSGSYDFLIGNDSAS